MLCENPWNGGGGYTPGQVAEMTPDQILFRLCEVDVLKREVGHRSDRRDVASMMAQADSNGLVAGRAKDGTQINLPIKGRSLARRLAEEEQARIEEEKSKQETGRRRRKRGN